MCAKFVPVGFLPPMPISLVRQEPALIAFRKKTKFLSEKRTNQSEKVYAQYDPDLFSYFLLL